MSNLTYREGFYNPQVKTRFLNWIASNRSKHSVIGFKATLSRAQILEESLAKDLYDFNIDEIEQFAKYLNCSTMSTISNRMSNVQSYITWAIGEGYTVTNMNPLDGIAGKEYYKKIIGSSKNILMTEQEVHDILQKTENYQDKAIVHSMFEGIIGKELMELRNIRRPDIHLDKLEVTLHDNGSKRILKFEDDLLIRTLIAACDEVTYRTSFNEEQTTNALYRRKGRIDATVSDYAVKRLRNEIAPAAYHSVLLRLRNVERAVKLEKNCLKPVNIRNSGMLRCAKNKYDHTGQLTDHHIKEICTRYNLNPELGYQFKRSFLNIETIKEVYES